jgi:hypothetical protein
MSSAFFMHIGKLILMIVTISTPESFVAVSWKFNPWEIIYTEYVLRLYLFYLLKMYVVKYIMQKKYFGRFYTLRPNDINISYLVMILF